MNPNQTAAIVQAAQSWVEAHERRKAAGRAKRQAQAASKLHPFVICRDEMLASKALSEAKRQERAALRALHRACVPKVITLRANARVLCDLVQLEASP